MLKREGTGSLWSQKNSLELVKTICYFLYNNLLLKIFKKIDFEFQINFYLIISLLKIGRITIK